VLEAPGFRGISLVGVLGPTIVVGRSAREVLSEGELDVAIAHEQAHRRAGDNLARVATYCAADLFGATRTAKGLEEAWRAASERRADAAAAGGDAHRATLLASALVKVARLAPAPAAPIWSSFHEARLLDLRVRSLLQPAPALAAAGSWRLASIVLACFVLAAAWLLALPADLHELTESLVRALW
jgi:beta-lactamase regulating signal transducer with metallopeptidase domain